ncbi:MAG: 50S ribosomal protein L32 [Patescibacteria group bacterium]|jgi:large subunit ribosomal protein L32|nr:50S ribosomal protein L32 [Patescibacteria group bacterium]
MSVSKKRKTSSSTRQGRSHDALAKKQLAKCKKCGKPVMPHQVCSACGTYQGREIVKPKLKTKKPNKK